jgi:hypothetical protein
MVRQVHQHRINLFRRQRRHRRVEPDRLARHAAHDLERPLSWTKVTVQFPSTAADPRHRRAHPGEQSGYGIAPANLGDRTARARARRLHSVSGFAPGLRDLRCTIYLHLAFAGCGPDVARQHRLALGGGTAGHADRPCRPRLERRLEAPGTTIRAGAASRAGPAVAADGAAP